MGIINIPKELCTPDTICHYTKASTCIEKILFYSSLRLSDVGRTNDPFEYIAPNLIIESTGISQSEIEDEFFEKPGHAVHIIALYYLQNLKILSFCMNDVMPKMKFEIDRLGFMRPRMWSQYGENHAGVCLLFSKKRITDDI